MKDNKGFTLVLALIILVLLSMMLGLFITMVTVNLRHANRFVAKSAIERVADEGIRYCDNMLMTSPEGADWRPVPDNISMDEGWEIRDVNVPPQVGDINQNAENLSKTDPDYKWLVPYWPEPLYVDDILYAGPDGGYTRINSGENRFLVRVTYAPVSKDINSSSFTANYYDLSSRFIKIESIAREGIVDYDDPTTLLPYKSNTTQYYLMAYKPIGITDYARFVTNKDKQNKTFDIGNGRITETYGRVKTRYTRRGAPIRVNGDVNFDNVNIILRALRTTGGDGDTIYSPRDLVEVSGTITGGNISVYDQDYNDVSNDVDFNDFRKEADTQGAVISELEAPLIDGKITDKSTTRYRQLTKNTGKVISNNIRSGEYGWGDGIYIDNFNDEQKESETLFGGYSLRADWLTPGNNLSNGRNFPPPWQGPYYIPPAAVIELSPSGISIQRTDFSRQGISYIWRDSDGNQRPEWGSTCNFDYPKNGVLFAEGNIRIKGMLPEDTQLTVVSNQNIYIDGNILKNRPHGTVILNAVDTEERKVADDSSAISLLARKNVVVNTTMFMKPMMSLGADNVRSDVEESGEPPFHIRLNPLNIGNALQWQFQFGPYESEENYFDGQEWSMAIRHSSDIDFVDAYLQTYEYGIRDWKDIDWGDNTNPYYPDRFSYSNRVNGGTDTGIMTGGIWKYRSACYKLYRNDFGSMNLSDYQYLKIFLDTQSMGEYIFGNIAINPMDVRIEALIYAQNGSFFVIPGYWFEPDINKVNKKIWDFGKQLDVRIIVDGAVSENAPAQKSDQISWMEK